MNITFTFQERIYDATMSRVQGAGDSSVYYLYINQYYSGRLRISAFDDQWIFDGMFADLAEALGIFLEYIGWVRSQMEQSCVTFFYELFAYESSVT